MSDTATTETTLPADGADRTDLDDFLGTSAKTEWYRRKRVLIAAAIGVLVVILLLLFGGRGNDSAYVTEEAKRQDLTLTVSATGNLQATNEVEVSSEQSGLVTEVYVKNNDRVSKNQPLARLDTSRLNDSVLQARASLASAQAQTEQYRATLAQANADFARQEEVYRISNGQVPSDTELDAARAEKRRAAAAVKAGEAQIAQARAQLATANTELSKATIYSPVTGVVLSRNVEPGQTVAATLSAPVLFRIAESLSQMELEVSIDEADVGQVEDGQSATFTVDAYPGRRFEAVIDRVDLAANASDDDTNTNNVISYTAVLTLSNPELILRPGMTATADIVTEKKENALVVPNAALRFTPTAAAESGGGVAGMMGPPNLGNQNSREVEIGRGTVRTIYVLGDGGQAEPRRVTVGSSDGSVTEIVSGELKPGEKVITAVAADGAGDSSPDDEEAPQGETAWLEERYHPNHGGAAYG